MSVSSGLGKRFNGKMLEPHVDFVYKVYRLFLWRLPQLLWLLSIYRELQRSSSEIFRDLQRATDSYRDLQRVARGSSLR